YKILSTSKETADDVFLRIETDINPQPGQFVQVSIPGIGEAPISTASCDENFLDLNIRVVGNVTKAIGNLKKNDYIHLRGPYGRGYPLVDFKGKNIVLIGGGCGVAPLRGVIKYLEKHRKDYDEITMFFGFRTPQDVLFKDEVAVWMKKYNFNMSVDKSPEDNPFFCPVGFVTQILDQTKIETKNTEVLLCGPPIMMDKCVEILKKKKFKDSQLWVSLERHMKCGVGKCGHCMAHGFYVCKDGPVFRYDEVKDITDE
ncbi:MAG: FAD/NAD(P)-binding protein, partial [Nanoarchaeota archaeon]|nr:FAD/NAD(P)-binding protein [Nanoarchaeota archaeon]MBU1849359.1 FAD/NAD(P)-binding protein [Nanoarchaeota archaeon]